MNATRHRHTKPALPMVVRFDRSGRLALALLAFAGLAGPAWALRGHAERVVGPDRQAVGITGQDVSLSDLIVDEVEAPAPERLRAARAPPSTPTAPPEGASVLYAFGLCIDQNYLSPGLATITALADSLALRARRGAALRVLTLDLAPAHVALLAHFAKRAGFGSFDIAHRAPLRASRMADASYITVTTYLRFEFTAAFVRRPYLVYVDADTLVRGDLTAPLHALRRGELGAVRDEFNPAVGECPALPGVAERWPLLRGRPYYNAGLLWAHTADLPRIRRGVERALIRQRKHILHNDQDALNLWLLHHGSVRGVGAEYNRFEVGRFLERGDWVRRVVARPLRADPAASLVHFVGPQKPWLASCPQTDDVREYRALLRRTMRHVRALGASHPEPTGVR